MEFGVGIRRQTDHIFIFQLNVTSNFTMIRGEQITLSILSEFFPHAMVPLQRIYFSIIFYFYQMSWTLFFITICSIQIVFLSSKTLSFRCVRQTESLRHVYDKAECINVSKVNGFPHSNRSMSFIYNIQKHSIFVFCISYEATWKVTPPSKQVKRKWAECACFFFVQVILHSNNHSFFCYSTVKETKNIEMKNLHTKLLS